MLLLAMSSAEASEGASAPPMVGATLAPPMVGATLAPPMVGGMLAMVGTVSPAMDSSVGTVPSEPAAGRLPTVCGVEDMAAAPFR